jgi:uncharacterized lipoprotein YmbA
MKISRLFANLVLATAVAAALGGCASSSTQTRYYLLTDPLGPDPLVPNVIGPSMAISDQCGISLGKLSVAPYLQRSNLILQTATNEIVPATHHRWGEPIAAGITRLLGNCLAGNARADERHASISIDHFHGSERGEVVLQAHWVVEGDEAVLTQHRFDVRMNQSTAGYDALVTTQRSLLLELCADILAKEPACEVDEGP